MNLFVRFSNSKFAKKLFVSTALASLLTSQLVSAPAFSGYYSENSADLADLNFAYMNGDLNGGFSLFGYAVTDIDDDATTGSPILARYDESGEELWAVFMNDTGELSNYFLIADFDSSEKFFAGIVEEGPRAVLSINNGSDLSSDFAYEIDLNVTPLKTTLNYFRDNVSGLIQDGGSSIGVLLLDSSGQKIFDKSYTSPDFLAEDILDGPGGNSSLQAVYLQQFEDKSGYLMSVVIVANDYTDPLNPSGTSTNIAIRLGNDGSVQWSKKFVFPVSTAAPVFPTVGPNNSVFYTISETKTAVDFVNVGFSIEQKTHFVKIGSSGDLEFSKTFNDALLGSYLTNVNSSSLYLSGSRLNEGSFAESTSVFLKISSSTGAIEAEAGFDKVAAGISNFSGRVSTGLVGSFRSEKVVGSGDYVTTLFRLDEDLENVLAANYSVDNAFGQLSPTSDDNIIFTSNFANAPQVGVFALDSDLNLIADGCDLFSSTSLNIIDPNIESEDLSLTTTNATITVSNSSTVLDAVTVPLKSLELSLTTCGDFVPGEGGGSGGGDGGTDDPIKLVNIATRGRVGADGDVMIGGFVVRGTSKKKILVQAVASELAGIETELKLSDPQFLIVPVATAGEVSTHLSNDNWSGTGTDVTNAIQAAGASVGATPLEIGSTSAALVAEIDPGAYTVIVSGVGGSEGIALIEVYEVE